MIDRDEIEELPIATDGTVVKATYSAVDAKKRANSDESLACKRVFRQGNSKVLRASG